MHTSLTLSIAGFDPSAGAGVLADVKTFEANGVYGFGVVSALTWQNDKEFDRVEWVSVSDIISQVAMLLRRFDIRFIKIGLIESASVLKQITSYLHDNIKDPIIIFDPILKASAGFTFHNAVGFTRHISGIHCITPNIPEAIQLFGNDSLEQVLTEMSSTVNIYLKGGHADSTVITDVLYTSGDMYQFSNARLPHGEKHGSGCVLSSALTAQLALGNDIITAAGNANRYVHSFLASSNTLLGHHNKEILV